LIIRKHKSKELWSEIFDYIIDGKYFDPTGIKVT